MRVGQLVAKNPRVVRSLDHAVVHNLAIVEINPWITTHQDTINTLMQAKYEKGNR